MFYCPYCGLEMEKVTEDFFASRSLVCRCGRRWTAFAQGATQEQALKLARSFNRHRRETKRQASEPKELASLKTRAKRYLDARERWKDAGEPNRSQERIDHIYDTHCSPCEYFEKGLCKHRKCGCHINRRRFMNKLVYATERCDPMNKWGPILVSIITPGLRQGGAERWVSWLVEHCDPTVIRMSVVAITGSRNRTDTLLANKIAEHCPVLPIDRAANFVTDSEVIVCWGMRSLPRDIASFGGKIINVSHGSSSRVAHMLSGNISKQATHRVAVSQESAKVFPDGSKVDVIYNGVDLERCEPKKSRASVRKKWGVGDDDRLICFIGRLNKDKRPELAAEACEILGEPYRAIYVGPEDATKIMQPVILKKSDRSVFVPAMEQIGDALGAVDLYALPSKHEAMSMTLTEAWAAGTPTVATPVGAVPELEQMHGQLTVRIAVDAAAEDMALAIKSALSTANETVVGRAKDVAREHYSVATMAANWNRYIFNAAGRMLE